MCVFSNQKRMQQIMTQCFLAVKSKLERRLGLFDLIGCDFMVDEDFKVWSWSHRYSVCVSALTVSVSVCCPDRCGCWR